MVKHLSSFAVVLVVATTIVFTACGGGGSPSSPTPVPTPVPTPTPGVTNFSFSFALPGTATPGRIFGTANDATKTVNWTISGPSGYEVWISKKFVNLDPTTVGIEAIAPGGNYFFSNPPEVTARAPDELLGTITHIKFFVWVPAGAGVRIGIPDNRPADFVFQILVNW